MAFPTTSVLDAFTGSDTSALGASWSTPAGANAMQIMGNAAAGTAAVSAAYRNDANYGDCEVWGTVSTKGANTGYLVLYARMNTTTFNGYSLTATAQSGTDTVVISRITGGTPTTLTTINQEFASGDAFGLEINGSTLTAYYKASGGSWGAIGTPQTDSTYSTAARIMMAVNNTDFRIDDFGGGTIVAGGGAAAGAVITSGAIWMG